VYPNTVCHAVLALLSEGYPPLEGRSPTCYSPVCHSTHGLLHFRVRLACVRHAASVDSEPGSNSQVKWLALRLTQPAYAGQARSGTILVNPIALLIGSLGLRYVKLRWFASAWPCDLALRHPLILDGFCACTFYLVFKEPSFFAPPLRVRSRLGEPSNCIIRTRLCQQKCRFS
jgi:hypothetical protein